MTERNLISVNANDEINFENRGTPDLEKGKILTFGKTDRKSMKTIG
jgi:hypothetical protein